MVPQDYKMHPQSLSAQRMRTQFVWSTNYMPFSRSSLPNFPQEVKTSTASTLASLGSAKICSGVMGDHKDAAVESATYNPVRMIRPNSSAPSRSLTKSFRKTSNTWSVGKTLCWDLILYD